ncbi:MAG: tRNA lysidine(34) synthetase TilS [Lentisphaerae bacterium]|nr:tRNA lysidine(34) synthetase TilS [Lentisphaerota bacterium]
MTFLQQIQRALHGLGIPGRARHVVVAVSGGADSVALLCALHDLAPRLGLHLRVAHLNHGVRGAAAREDARFVRALSRRLKVPCEVGRMRVKDRARARGQSFEMVARAARYEFLLGAARRWQARSGGVAVALATAHTADDQAETLLLRLARGAGSGGLAGIPVERMDGGVRIVRPLLEVRRAAVLEFLNRHHQDWREDDSNRDPAMRRNRVRHEILPQLAARLNPDITQALLRTADVLRAEDAWMTGWVEAMLPGMLRPSAVRRGRSGLAADLLAAQPLAARRRLILMWLRRTWRGSASADFKLVDALDELAGSRRARGAVALPGGCQIVRRAGVLQIERASGRGQSVARDGHWERVVRVPGVTRLAALGLRITAGEGREIRRERPGGIGVFPACATLAWKTLRGRPLSVRRWRAGDRMAPLGLAGRQKLQDIFVNAKIPREARSKVPVFICDDDIVWLPGYRVARGWAVGAPGERMLELHVDAL